MRSVWSESLTTRCLFALSVNRVRYFCVVIVQVQKSKMPYIYTVPPKRPNRSDGICDLVMWVFVLFTSILVCCMCYIYVYSLTQGQIFTNFYNFKQQNHRLRYEPIRTFRKYLRITFLHRSRWVDRLYVVVQCGRTSVHREKWHERNGWKEKLIFSICKLTKEIRLPIFIKTVRISLFAIAQKLLNWETWNNLACICKSTVVEFIYI